jgi:NADH dehydrogenase (ubiquinone) 1 alpha subcomplex subunit 6
MSQSALARSAAATAAAAATPSGVRAAQAKRVVALFRALCRDAPRVRVMYGLESSEREIRAMALSQFRKQAAVTEPRIIESLLARGAMEREETINQWKQKGHLLALLHPEAAPADPWLDEEEFFRRFLDGTINESAVWAGFDPKKIEARAAALRRAEAHEAREAREAGAGAAQGEDEVARVEALLRRLAASEKSTGGAEAAKAGGKALR